MLKLLFKKINVFQDKNLIIKNLYLGNKLSAMENNNYTLIVNCSTNIKFYNDPQNKIRINLIDNPSQAENMYKQIIDNQVLEKIHNNLLKGNKVLVHCRMGRQRSAAIVACYLIKYHNYTCSSVINFIRNKRPEAFYPTINFKETILKIYKNNI